MYSRILPAFLLVFLLISCRQEAATVVKKAPVVTTPSFVADSAYLYVQTQVDFGPRVPNTRAHVECAAYLAGKLRAFGAEVTEQKADLRAFDGTILRSNNIIGAFNPAQKNRILLFAHWDSRPWSDHDPNPANHNKPVIGANDGASGVGVLLEVARLIGKQQPNVGVDIIFFDAEDYGAPETFEGDATDSWCLGSQYWAANPHVPGYRARFGILLDMVGAPDAVFYREQISDMYAPTVVDKVWRKASDSGFQKYFINERGGAVTDDHLYVNRIAGIPSINIIHYHPQNKNGFGDFWHTVNDDMRNIDKNTLHAVGTTVLSTVFSE